MPRNVTAQPPFRVLVAHIEGASDPSKGASGNPVKIRTSFDIQHFPDVPRGTPRDQYRSRRGAQTHVGHAKYTTPDTQVASEGELTVVAGTLRGPTTLQLGDFILTTGIEIDDSANAVVGEDITDTAPNGVIVIFKTAGAGGGEGTISAPSEAPIIAGSVTISWTSGAAGKTQTDDGSGGFTGDGNPSGSSINYVTGAITLDTTGFPPDGATTITITYDSLTAAALASAIESAVDDLPGFSATVLGAVVTISGPAGPIGNQVDFLAGGSCPYLFSLSPDDGTLGGAEPSIGPMASN